MSDVLARALAALQAGRAAEAESLLRVAQSTATDFVALQVLGAALGAQGRHDGALEAFERAATLQPPTPALLHNRARALLNLGRREEALQGFRQALQGDAAFAPARAALAGALDDAGLESYRARRYPEAIASLGEALALDPSRDGTRNSLGGALAALGRFDEAEECFRAVCARSPGDADAINNLGTVLQARGDLGAAAGQFERALAIRPAHADALTNLGFVRQEEGRFEESEALYRRALAADPGAAIAGYNLGILRLRAFDFAAGWELNELRYKTVPPIATAQRFDVPQFGPDDWGRGERIALWGEQGIGDRIVYSTLVPELEERGERFVMETDARLVGAYRRAHPRWTVVTREESIAAFAQCTRHIALASLPRLTRPSLQSFERQPVSVLAADPERSAQYRARLEAPGRLRVGISWRSFQKSARGALQRRKSAPLAAFLALSRRADLTLVDLQYGDTGDERADFAAQGASLARLAGLDLFHDIEGVLAAIDACDVVLTTSNVTAHLAGALGKRTILVHLGANPPFHYWACDAAGQSLWYPSMRIITDARWNEAVETAGERIGA